MRSGRGAHWIPFTEAKAHLSELVDRTSREHAGRGRRRAGGCQPNVKLVVLPTSEAIEELRHASADTNAILHVTC